MSTVENYIMELLLEPCSSISTSNSSSDSEDWQPPKRITRVENYIEIVHNYSDITFREHFRISRTVVYNLISEFGQSQFQPSFSYTYISAEQSVLLCIWYLSNTESFRQIADRFNVSYSSAHRILVRVLNFILSLRSRYIKWPNNRQMAAISREFQKKHNLQGVVGCIDGKHIRIRRPIENEEVYVNRKGYHSVLLQGIVDNRRIFTDVYCGEPGSMHDARLLRKPSIFTKAQDPSYFGNYFLLGDSAYPSLPWLIPPFKDNGNLTQDQKEFNFRLSSTRMPVEHAFGLLSGRFRRINNFENQNLQVISKCIMCACILHNICCIENDDNDIDMEPVSDDEDAILTMDNGTECRRLQVFRMIFSNN